MDIPLIPAVPVRMWEPWVGSRYASDGYRSKRILILGESHYGGDGCHYPEFTREVIRDMALVKGHLPFFSRVQRLIVGGRGGFSLPEREDFWQRVAFCNFIQTALEQQGHRPTYEMWQAGREPFLQTIRELAPNVILVLGVELNRNLPAVPDGISVCPIQHPSAIGFSYGQWQPKVLSAIAANAEQGAAGQPLGFPLASDVLSNSNLNPASDVRRHPSGASA